VPALNEDELQRLVDDHYTSESQTLTTGAEHNLLKLAELRGRLAGEALARWESIKKEFQRLKLVGGSDDDPVARVTGVLSTLAEGLRGIQSAVGNVKLGEVDAHLYGIQQSVAATAAAISKAASAAKPPPPPPPQVGPEPAQARRDELLAGYLDRLERTLKTLSAPKLEVQVHNQPPPGIEELLAQQIAIIERTLVPLVRTTNQSLANPTAVDLHVQELLRLMRTIDERLRAVVVR
ncbi:MAG TPA: DNA repair protein, partial [Nannocystaceae bacterium]|nr:DNA repair protein [Nannocystaceae bacterium]